MADALIGVLSSPLSIRARALLQLAEVRTVQGAWQIARQLLHDAELRTNIPTAPHVQVRRASIARLLRDATGQDRARFDADQAIGDPFVLDSEHRS